MHRLRLIPVSVNADLLLTQSWSRGCVRRQYDASPPPPTEAANPGSGRFTQMLVAAPRLMLLGDRTLCAPAPPQIDENPQQRDRQLGQAERAADRLDRLAANLKRLDLHPTGG
jgi:hypothetical protein